MDRHRTCASPSGGLLNLEADTGLILQYDLTVHGHQLYNVALIQFQARIKASGRGAFMGVADGPHPLAAAAAGAIAGCCRLRC